MNSNALKRECFATNFVESTHCVRQPDAKLQVLKKKITILHFYLMHEYLYFHKLFPGRSLYLLLFEYVIFDSERQTQKYTHRKRDNKFDLY